MDSSGDPLSHAELLPTDLEARQGALEGALVAKYVFQIKHSRDATGPGTGLSRRNCDLERTKPGRLCDYRTKCPVLSYL